MEQMEARVSSIREGRLEGFGAIQLHILGELHGNALSRGGRGLVTGVVYENPHRGLVQVLQSACSWYSKTHMETKLKSAKERLERVGKENCICGLYMCLAGSRCVSGISLFEALLDPSKPP